MKNIYTVGQVNRYIRGMFRQDILLQGILVRGEVSNVKYHTSGHIYFSLKDQAGTLSCILFAGNRKGLTFPMKNGDNVVCSGSVDVYTKKTVDLLYDYAVPVPPNMYSQTTANVGQMRNTMP